MGGRLAFDIDGVLYPWHELILEQFIREERVPLETTVGDIFGYGKYFDRLPKSIRNQYLRDPTYYYEPIIREGAGDVIDALKDTWDILYITARYSNLEAVTRAWAWNMRLPKPHQNLYVVDGDKRAVARALGVTVFVEDHLKYVEQLWDICSVVLLSRPWNESYEGYEHTRIEHVRINTLHELVPLLNGNANV